MPSAATVAAVVDTHRRFDGRVVYRQVATGLAGQPRPALWRPTRRPWRWNDAFPTLYTALSLEVAYAERLKRTGAAPVRLVVGRGGCVDRSNARSDRSVHPGAVTR